MKDGEDRVVQWISGRPPRAVPLCGFHGEKCLPVPGTHTNKYQSGTDGRCCIGVHSPALCCVIWRHDRHFECVTSYQKSRLRQSMPYFEDNPAKFHPDPIWNDGTLDHFWGDRANKNNNNNNNKMSRQSSDRPTRSIPDTKIALKGEKLTL